MAKTATGFAPLVRQPTIAPPTYRRDGSPVDPPVHIEGEGQRAFMRSWDTAGKIKRIRNNPDVAIAPCTLLGRVTGSAVRARARVLGGTEAEAARRALARKYPVLHG